MEISGPACNLRINDNPDNYNIQDELNAINEPTPGWDKDIGKGIFMGKPIAYWIELDNHARELGLKMWHSKRQTPQENNHPGKAAGRDQAYSH